MARDRLAAVADPEVRDTLLRARARSSPFTADEIAADLGVSRTVARRRLDRLVESGLLLVDFERRTGRTGPGAGRPAKVYRVAPELRAIEFPRRRYEQLVAALLEQLPASRRSRSLRRAGEEFGRELADAADLQPLANVRAGLERVCEAVRSLGFHASVVDARGAEATLTTPTCPLRPVVVAHPEATEIDRGMWRSLVERGVRGVRVEDVRCETADCLDDEASCRISFRLRRQEASSSGATVRR